MPQNSHPGRTSRIDITPRTGSGAPSAARRTAPGATEQFVARRAARANRDTPYDKLLASVYDAVLITDLQGVILDFNNRALEFFLADEHHFPGRSIIDCISGADAGLLDTIRRNLEGYLYTVVEAYCTRADGTTFSAEIAVNAVNLDAEGQLCFFIRDTTERMRAQQELRNAVERLEALDRARLEFVSNVSHELRTPLTSMIYAVKNMQRGVAGPLPEKAMQYLDRLYADCRRLLSTVNDILDLRQSENRTLTLNRTRVLIARLVEVGVDSLRVQAEEKRIRMIMCKPDWIGFVLCDPHRMERVILNIVGNAIKFTPPGGTISIVIERGTTDTNQVVIHVRDTGIGIPPEALDRITVRYYKIGDQPTGSGLGLAISRELIDLHGGRLQIESPVPGTDRGTQVSVILPLIAPPRVLVVTADDALLEQLHLLCEEQGFPGEHCRNVRSMDQVCRQDPPDLLIIDQHLPDTSGMELILQIRDDRRMSHIPIILIADDSLTRAQLDMLHAFQIPMVPKPLQDQMQRCAFNTLFYDRTLTAGRRPAASGKAADSSPTTITRILP